MDRKSVWYIATKPNDNETKSNACNEDHNFAYGHKKISITTHRSISITKE
jgi:hypothetical protein